MIDAQQVSYLFFAVAGLAVSFITAFAAYRFVKLYELKTRMEMELNEREFFSRYSDSRRATERAVSKLQGEITDTPDEFSDVNHLVVDGQKRMSALSRSAIDPTTFLSDLRIDVKNIGFERNLVFVLTPFDTVSLPFLDAVIEAFKETNMSVLRGDEDNISGEILPHIVEKIVRARLIIANIEGRNPNVMYELGISHALGKDVIIASGVKSTEEEGLPFDLRSRQIILYSSRDDLVQKLKANVIRRFFSS